MRISEVLTNLGIKVHPEHIHPVGVDPAKAYIGGSGMGGDNDGSCVNVVVRDTSGGIVLNIHHQVAQANAHLEIVSTSNGRVLDGTFTINDGFVHFGPDGRVTDAQRIEAHDPLNIPGVVAVMVLDNSFTGPRLEQALSDALLSEPC